MNKNGDNAWDVTADGIITLKGVFGVGNPSGNNPVSPSASVVIIRPCSVPPPVVLKLVVDDERAALGVKVKDDVVYERKESHFFKGKSETAIQQETAAFWVAVSL